MNQPEVAKLISGLRIKMLDPKFTRPVKGRRIFESVRPHVGFLILNERMELPKLKAYQTRIYAERLITDAIFHGDKHSQTMEIAQWWLGEDPSAVHKLFKVLVPRFKEETRSYTRIIHTPLLEFYGGDNNLSPNNFNRCMLELRGNPFPPIDYPNSKANSRHLHNILLTEAKKDLEMQEPLPGHSS